MVCLGRPYHFNFFKGCLPQILLGPFLHILTHLSLQNSSENCQKFLVIIERFSVMALVTTNQKMLILLYLFMFELSYYRKTNYLIFSHSDIKVVFLKWNSFRTGLKNHLKTWSYEKEKTKMESIEES